MPGAVSPQHRIYYPEPSELCAYSSGGLRRQDEGWPVILNPWHGTFGIKLFNACDFASSLYPKGQELEHLDT